MAPLPKPSGNNAQSSGTSTPPPTEMGTLVEEEQLVVGALYWIEDERGDDVWASAEVLDHCEGHVMVQMTDSGERKEIDLDLEEMLPKNPAVVADMTALHHIHEPGILHNLKERARPWRQTPYTFMGTILLAVNPLKAVPMPPVEQFMDQPLDPETPHPYAIAELAYRQMRLAGGRAGTNQSIVVSGESGAGKTETVKIILSYLARRSKGADEDLEGRVLESSPLLESFGNARTLRNDNSSRFGKFLKLRFTSGESSYLLGASVEPYLLEKSRVLSQGEGERNFHILYDLVAGALQSDLGEKLKLKGVSEYSILSSSGCTVLEGVDDADRFKAIQDAFTTVGVDSEAQLQVWQALSGVLHLSELQIEEADHEEGPVAAITDRETLSTVASMLGVETQKLEEMLTRKVVPVTRGEVFTKRLGKTEANRGRGAVVKSLYEAIFLWVVRAINLALGGASKLVGDDKLPFIGLLDIFGFENFGHKNNLEQLLINYANESLQGDFNRQVFENELRVYAEEGIEVSVSAARYTSSCLRMLAGKRDGVLPILDDVCSQPLPSDKRYLERLHLAFSRRQGNGVDVPEKITNRDVYSRSSAGSDADDASAITSPGPNRKWGGGSETGFRGDLAGTDEEGGGTGGGRRRWDAAPPTSRSSRGRAFGGDDGPNDGGAGGSSAGGSAFGRSGKWDRDRYGSEVGGSSTHSADDAVTEVRSLEWLGRGGALADDFRTEEHESFWVNHYASKVLYTVDGWVERNMDSVPQSFSETMLTSSHAVVLDATTEFLADRMPDKDKDKEKRSVVDAPIPRKTSVRRDLKTALAKRTVAGNFMASMNNLSTTLAATTCNFIRCIKPNAAMDFGIFDSQFVVEQLRCLGVLRTCEMLKLGMPTRVSYVDLKQSLGEGTLEAEKMFEGEPEKSLVAAILWAFDVPAEAFRLGAKRVFFRAGQISVLHKILNETPADKVPWVLSRLRLALANRRMAKIAAEEAEDSLAEAEATVMEAEAISSSTRSGVSGSQQDAKAPMSPGSTADADMMALVATIEKARRAAKNAAQVKTIIKSAEAEGVGEHAPGAAEKIKASSEAALADIAKAAERADELEKLTTLGVFGLNGAAGSEKEMSSLRELHLAMRGIRNGLADVKKFWKSAEEAADKCQGKPAVVSAKQAKEKAIEVVEKAKQVSENSKKAIDVARRQRRAKDVATRATEKALKSFRSLQVVARQATLEEKRFRENPGLSVAADEGNATHSSSAPGSGLIQAAKAALAGTVAYESLTDAQKQQRAEEQKAASVEAAAAIAEAEKEEVQKREELAILEKQRLQELEEEAAVAAAERLEQEARKEDGGEMTDARYDNPPSPSELPDKDSPRPKKVVAQAEPVEAFEAASSGDRDSLRPAPVQSFLAARKASAGNQAPASGLGQEKASGGGWTSVSTRRAFSRQGSGGSALEAVAAATAAVEAVTGMKSFTPRGAKEAVAKEAAATSAPGADTGWGEMVEEAGDGNDGVPASRAKATEAQVKAAHAKAKAAEAQIKAAHAHARARAAHAEAAEAAGSSEGHLGITASTTIATTGWGENGDQTGPGSIKDRLGTFTSRGKAAGNATSDSTAESSATGRVHGRIGAALGSRSSPFQGAAGTGNQTPVPASTSGSGSQMEVARAERSSAASNIVGTGGLEGFTASTNLDPVLETAEFGEQQYATDSGARANGAPAAGVPAANLGQETPLDWAAGREQDSPDVAEKPLEAFSGINAAFVHHRKYGEADVNDRTVGDGNTYVDADDGRVQSYGWGEDGDQSAPGSVRDRLSAFTGSRGDGAYALGGIDKDGAPADDGESAPFRRMASGRRAPGSVKGRLGAFSGKEGDVSPSSDDAPTPYRRAVPGGTVQSMGGTSGRGEIGDQADPETKNHRGALARGNNGTGSVVVTTSSGDGKALPYRQPGWGANGDQSAPRSIKNELGAFSGSKDITSPRDVTPRHRTAPFADQSLTDAAAPSASGEEPSSLSRRSTVALDEAATSVRGALGDGSPRKRSEGFSRPSLSPIAAAASRRDVNGVSGWGKNGNRSASGSVNKRLADFTRASANGGVGPSDADGESFVGGDDGDENNTDAPMRSPSSLERSAPQASSALAHASDHGEVGDEPRRLSSVRTRVGALSAKGGGTPRSGRAGETGVGVGSKTSSPASRSPPYGRGASGGSRSWVGRADEPADQIESGGVKRGPGSVKDRLAAYSQGRSGVYTTVGGGRISPSGSRSPGSVGSADAVGSATAGVGDAQDSANGESRQKLASSSSWSASVDRGASVSVKQRLAAFSKVSSSSGSGSSIGSSAGGGSKINGVGLGLSKGDVRARFGAVPGSRSPSYNRGGAGGGSAEASLVKEGAVGGGLAKATVGGRSPRYQRGGGFSEDKSGGIERTASTSRIGTSRSLKKRSGGIERTASTSTIGTSRSSQVDAFSKISADGSSASSPSLDRPLSKKDVAIAALAAAEAEAAREEEEWTRKMRAVEEERRRVREERMKVAAEAVAIAEQGEEGADGEDSFASLRARTSRLEGEVGEDAGEGGVGGGGRIRSRKRSMKKSGFPYGGGDGGVVGEDGSETSFEYDVGTSTAREIDGISEEDEDDVDDDQEDEEEDDDRDEGEDDDERPWPEAAMAAGRDDEGGETMEAKKPMSSNGWHASPDVGPWRSPERAPEYGNNGSSSGSPRGGHPYARSKSFAGDPNRARHTARDKMGSSGIIVRNHSMDDELGEQEEAMVSWTADPKKGEEGGEGGNVNGKGPVILESMLFKDDAKEVGIVEARVMSIDSEDKSGKPSRRAPKWSQYYFRLRDGVLTKSPARRSSFPGNSKESEDMNLTSETVTSYTNTKNCFCVRTGEVSWFLLGRSLADMKRWMHAINLQVRYIFQKEHGVHDDYQGQGRHGRFFYRMVEGSVPQWILTHPMAKAPRTGDGLFPGEVIEVTQVLGIGGSTFLRLANERGWTYARSPTNRSVLFEDLAGSVSEDTETYSFPSGSRGIVPILHGPGLRTQATGVTIQPGERALAAERFTPVDGSSIIFVKLADGRGWVPVKNSSYTPPNVLEGW